MVRIIPWNLPPVNGGSVGGYTPEPTPPVPTNYPYDLDNMSLITSFASAGIEKSNSYVRNRIKGQLTISGVTILDSTSVSSVIATVQITAGTDTWNNTTGFNWMNDAEINVDISSYMTPLGGTVDITNKTGGGVQYLDNMVGYKTPIATPYPEFVSTTGTVTVTSIKVYNSNGVVIQEWTP